MSQNVTDQELVVAAKSAREHAYAVYSKFAVGAALLTDGGEIFVGCNVENLSFGLTICAERSAVYSAIGAGRRKFVRIAVCADSVEPVTPCGACRQVLAEFAPEVEVVSVNLAGSEFRARISELLPRPKAGILG